MNRKRTAVVAGSVSLLVVLAGCLVVSLKYQPTFYQSALANRVPPEVRREQAKAFVKTTLQLVDGIRNEDRWSHEFTEDAVNSWLAEELPAKYSEWLPPEVSSPRVKFEKGALLLAFQIRHGMWNGVVSGKVRPWVTGPNQLALEFQSARVGLVPVPVDELLGDFIKDLNDSGWRLQWKNHGRHDVLVVTLDKDFSPERGEHPVLDAVEIGPKLLRIAGRRTSETADAPRLAEKPAAR
jgi:hypothetical protein